MREDAKEDANADARTDEKGHVSESPPPDPMTCAGLVEASWRHVLPVLSQLLATCHTEALVLNLLKVPLC